ncbi:MAG: vitamin B12-dependent ribonucleotide reductase [Clostridiales bacterium]|jgi:ribonucleoside-diphosphate reductase alpha chain|nr:vitamin B12-dependent ribonucleotide reductase [Clostridiales bacterium]MDR2711533.1 vitamin B12-dependent ribonucleotide reductase [Clostridiales bacterium]
MKITENARVVLEKRYLNKDGDGNLIETVEELFDRVAGSIAAADKLHREDADIKKTKQVFYDMMTNLEFLPNSPTLMNAGRPLGQLSACFVLPIGDSMGEIFETLKQAALIHQSGGGTGFSFSRLRPKGSMVRSTGGVASGPISFMKVFNIATEAVKQGGTRRGANMGILRIDHPDILEFIDCKKDSNEINNFNISVGLTEKFMQAVINNEDYELIDPNHNKAIRTLSAREVYDKIVDSAWQNGEPGIIFLDRLNRDNAVPQQGEIEATNPCGEQPLLPYESCNLGSINLVNMVKKSGSKNEIDWDKLAGTVENAVHFLDNVIDVNKYPIEQIRNVTKETRKIGLGVMGWADLLLLLGIAYNSQAAVDLAGQVMAFINDSAKKASRELAGRRGVFPLYGESIYAEKTALRNATVTTIAPTGTLSIIAGVSSGVEPVFGYVFIRNVMDSTQLIEVNPILEQELKKRGLYSEELMKKIAGAASLSQVEELPQDIRDIFVSAHDVSPGWHIKMQAAFQQHTDNAVSKTVNFPFSATREDVSEVYMLAYELGCKGVTIYRDGSRTAQVLNIGKVNSGTGESRECEQCQNYEELLAKLESEKKPAMVYGEIQPRPRPEITQGFTERCEIGCGKLYITINYDEDGICEVFTNTGRHGGCPSQSEATARLVTVALRSGVDARHVVKQLRGIRCPSTIRQPGKKASSCPDAIAKIIESTLNYQDKNGSLDGLNGTTGYKGLQEVDFSKQARNCPECGARVEHEGGCVVCRHCGYSKCG